MFYSFSTRCGSAPLSEKLINNRTGTCIVFLYQRLYLADRYYRRNNPQFTILQNCSYPALFPDFHGGAGGGGDYKTAIGRDFQRPALGQLGCDLVVGLPLGETLLIW